MARYIDADGLIEKLQETICSKCNMYDGIKCKSCSIDDTLDFLENAPTADVVPKSEVERWRRNLEAVLEERGEEKSEIAREIFEEIDKVHEDSIIILDGMGYLQPFKFEQKITELKKKYTGRENNG